MEGLHGLSLAFLGLMRMSQMSQDTSTFFGSDQLEDWNKTSILYHLVMTNIGKPWKIHPCYEVR